MYGDEELFARARELQPRTVDLRRRIHRRPELGLHLPETTAAALEAIADLGLEIAQGPSTSGFVATLRGARPGPTILLRGDMDALPMPEDVGLAFKSEIAGRMHACGHDAHTAMLASAARLLHARRDRLAGTVKLMFQPGEEGFFGAKLMIDDGLLDQGGAPDAAFALHIYPNLESGVVMSRPGAFLAAADAVTLRVVGQGGHASMPHLARDPIPAAAEIVLALQALVTRGADVFDPAVLTIARIAGGSTNNVIPEHVELEGTLRTVSEATRATMRAGIVRVAEGIAAAHGLSAEVRLDAGYPVTLNDPAFVAFAKRTTIALLGAAAWRDMPAPLMGAEDFSYVLHRMPGCMAFLGVAPPGCDPARAHACHSNHMTLDEDAMAAGVALHAAVAERFLAAGGRLDG